MKTGIITLLCLININVNASEIEENKYNNIFNINDLELKEKKINFISNINTCQKDSISSKNNKIILSILGKSSNKNYFYKNKCVIDFVHNKKIETCLYPLKEIEKVSSFYNNEFFSDGKIKYKYKKYCMLSY